jgi:hypothetical protein
MCDKGRDVYLCPMSARLKPTAHSRRGHECDAVDKPDVAAGMIIKNTAATNSPPQMFDASAVPGLLV